MWPSAQGCWRACVELFLTTKIKKPPKGTAPADAAELVFKQIKEDFKVLNVNNVDMLMLRDSRSGGDAGPVGRDGSQPGDGLNALDWRHQLL